MAAEPPAETGDNGVIASLVGDPLEDRPWPDRAVHRGSRRARLRQRRRGRAVGTARQRRRRPSRAGRLADPPSAPTRPRPPNGLLRRSTRDRARTLGPGPPGRGGGTGGPRPCCRPGPTRQQLVRRAVGYRFEPAVLRRPLRQCRLPRQGRPDCRHCTQTAGGAAPYPNRNGARHRPRHPGRPDAGSLQSCTVHDRDVRSER